MPFVAQNLIDGKPKPTTVLLDDPAQRGLELMVENNFSQLPVIDPANKPIGLVTGDSILRGVATLRIPLDKLRIAHVMEKVDRFYPTDYPIFDLQKGLNAYPAVLITDSDSKLVGIVTNWDTADYFRERAIDIMMLADVEDLLKAHIRAAFSRYQPQNTDKLLEAAINKIATRNTGKNLDDLTLYEFTSLLLYEPTWTAYSSYLDIPTENLKQLLDDIRKSRNAVAHFKREISEWERRRIKYCISLLQETYPPLEVQISITSDKEDEIIPIEEEFIAQDGMYAPLARYLQGQPSEIDRLQKTFKEIEDIIGTELPDSAREHRSWWANDSVSHSHSQQWLAAGWRMAGINMTEGVVTFLRNRQRELAYISFFSALLNDLRAKADFEVWDVSPGGTSWATAKALPLNNRKQAWLNFSFTRKKELRVELYIDSGDEHRNKHIFEKLYEQKNQIEAEFGSALSWERLDSRRASRIAAYHLGFITDKEPELASLRSWGVEKMIQLEKAIADKAENAIQNIQ